MCGIVGIYNLNGQYLNLDILVSMWDVKVRNERVINTIFNLSCVQR